MAIIFPPTPTAGQTFVGGNGVTYTYNNTLGVWTASGQGGTVISPATLAEAAAGSLASVYSSPQTAVPKDAAGMTGAAILPSGTDAQRTAITTPVVGMQRFNTDSGYEEVYAGAALGWQKFSYLAKPATLPADLNWSGAVSAGGFYQANNFTVANGTTITPTSAVTEIAVYGNVTIGDSTTWNYAQAGNVGSWAPILTTAGIPGINGNGGAPGIAYLDPSISLAWGSFSPGSGASGTATSSSSSVVVQQGGSAGGCLIIRCFGNIVIGNSNTFSVNGGDAVTVAGYTRSGGGAGGGAGGTILIQAAGSLTIGTSTFTSNGGNGGNGSNAGGLTATSFGGGGGGGGYIILGSAGALSDSSTKTVLGGTAGLTQAGATNNAGGGGGNGGAGGQGGSTLGGATQNGVDGQVLNLYVL